MALINTAGILAGRRGFHVLVLDLDLEAPGLSYLDPESPDAAPGQAQGELPLQPGFVDLLTDAKVHGQDGDLFKLPDADLEAKYTRKIRIPEQLREFPGGSLRIMPAGRFDHNYAQCLDALNLNDLYREGVGEPLLRAFKKKLVESGLYDYVLVDSRTGISEGAGICTRDLADHVVVLSGLNRQNVEGTSEFLREFRAATDGKKTFQIILSPMPNGEDELLDKRRTVAERRFAEAWGSKVEVSLEIPYHPQLALTEEPHIFRRRRGYLFEAYQAIEHRMLQALGHDDQNFQKRITESLAEKRYEAALRELDHMIRLDGGQWALTRVAAELLPERHRRRSSEPKPEQVPSPIESLNKDKRGRPVAEFIVDKIPLEADWITKRLIHEFKEKAPELAERLVKRLLEVADNNDRFLGEYAIAFEEEGLLDYAEALYRKGIEIDSKSATNLWNFGDFLWKRRKDLDGAKSFYTRAIEADPKNGNYLAQYATFLRDDPGNMDAAESFYERALDADPQNVYALFGYAVLLQRDRGDLDGAKRYYEQGLLLAPEFGSALCNYGQVLACLDRPQEAEKQLRAALENVEDNASRAEICLALWFVSRMQGNDATRWERNLRLLIQKGFERSPWNFDRLLEQANGALSADELEYAKALVSAFLDETKVADLAKYTRWESLGAPSLGPSANEINS